MKKFLFTLAALMMAGSAFADNYFFIEDFEVPQDKLGSTMKVDVKAHFDNYVSAWQFDLGYMEENGDVVMNALPEGITKVTSAAGADMKNMPYTGDDGEDYDDYSPNLKKGMDGTRIIVAADQGNYSPDGELYGCVKWAPADYGQMWTFTFTIAADFKGATLVLQTAPSCGTDTRPEVQENACPKNETFVRNTVITVEGGTVEPEVTEKPVITTEEVENGVMVTATGNGHICLYVEDVLVAEGEGTASYLIESSELEEEYGVSATAQEEGKEVSEYALATVYVPAAVVVPEVTPKPIIDILTDQESETVTVRATGYGHICIYWDDQLMAEGEGVAEWVIPFGEDPEGEEYGVSATAQEEGYEVSEYALATVFVPGKAEPQPYETPAPEVVETMTDDALLITATGEGTVTIYVQTIDNETGAITTETYEGEGTVSAVIPRGDETYFINYWAVAQANEDAEPGSTQVSYFVEVPAQEITPVDPSHEQGVWIVTYLVDGTEFWQEMLPSNNDYTCIVRFSYGNYGTFPYDPNKSMAENDAMRPNMPFYIVIDGVRYGAAEDGTLCVLGTALSNELFENENDYVLENALGRVYNMGVAIDELDPSKKYVYAAVAAYTEVEEMNASKTVAGVRYFNMAGQEMQEANGMTIVVTTYTDGTTSAVKVMK